MQILVEFIIWVTYRSEADSDVCRQDVAVVKCEAKNEVIIEDQEVEDFKWVFYQRMSLLL